MSAAATLTDGAGAIAAQALVITTEDGSALAGRLFRPAASVRQAVLLAGGLGIAQRFYAPFAGWLAQQGHLVLSFDLRGMGASRLPQHRRSLRGLHADMLTWAEQDFAAALRCLSALAQRPQVTVLGHSLGAHHAGMAHGLAQQGIRKLVSVAAGAGYWRNWAAPSRRLAPLMLHAAVPLLTPLFGYFPGKRLGMVADMPAGAARQWARWCRHPGFAWGAQPVPVAQRMAAARFPITAFGFTDDGAMTEQCTRTLLAAFSQAPSALTMLQPQALGLQAIGHLGAFRAEARAALWPLLERALD